MRRWLERATRPGTPPPAHGHWAQLAWGAAQPLLGLRALFSRRELARFAVAPLLCLLLLCALVPFLHLRFEGWPSHFQVFAAPPSFGAWLRSFYGLFAALAVVPSVLFADHYFRLAARARSVLGFGVWQPRREGLWKAIRLAVRQAATISLPFILSVVLIYGSMVVASGALDARMPQGTLISYSREDGWEIVWWLRALYWLVAIPWSIEWIVVDALDSARVLRADGRASDADAVKRPPRLAHWMRWVLAGILMKRWSKPWWEEFAVAEGQPWIALGFMATTGLILTVPVVQFAFRPAIIVAAAHWLAHLERSVSQRTNCPLAPEPGALTENAS